MSSSKKGGGKRSLTLGETTCPFSEWAYLSRHPTISDSPCPSSPSHRSVTVTLGAHNLQKKEDTWQRLEVIKQFPYPKYEHVGLHDIMLLKVGHEAALTLGHFHPGFCIPHEPIPDPPPVQPLRGPNAEKKATP